MKNVNSFIKDTISTLFYQGFSLIILFLINLFVARTLGPSGKGIFSVYLLIPSLLSMVLSLSIDEANVYFTSKGVKVKSVITVSLIYTFFASIFLLIFYHGFPHIFEGAFKNIDERYIVYAILITPLFLLFRNIRTIFLGTGRIGTYNFLDVARLVILLFLLGTFIIMYSKNVGFSLMAVNYHIAFATFISIALVIPILSRGDKTMQPFKLFIKEIKYGLKAYPGITLNFFNKRLDVFILNYFRSPYEVGIYSISTAMAELMWKIPHSIATPLFPKVAQEEKKNSAKFTLLVARFTFALLVLIAGIMALIGKVLIVILFGNKFQPSFLPFLWLLPGIVFLSMGRVLSAFFHGINKPEYGSFFTIVSVIFTIFFDFVLIPPYGAVGAAIASTIAYTVSGIIAILLFSYETKIPPYRVLQPPFSELFKITKRRFHN